MEEKLNSTLLKKKKIIKIAIITDIILLLIFILAIFNYSKHDVIKALAGISSILFLCNCCFILFYKENVLKTMKKEIFNAIIPEIFGTGTYMPQGMPQNMYNESKLYLNYNAYFASDRIKKGMNQLDISNVTTTLKNQNTSTTIFKGIFAIMKLDDFYKDEILIKPDYENKFVSTLVDSKNKMLGENENVVRLENLEFEKYFEVYSKNQIKARQLLTVEYMEKMVNMKNKLNTLIKVRYFGDKKYVAIWNKRLIDEKDFYKNCVNLDKIKENIKEIYEVIQKV